MSKGTIFAKNADFWQKNADISKIKGVLVLEAIFSQTRYVCVLTNQISSLEDNSNESFRQGGGNLTNPWKAHPKREFTKTE